MSSKIMKVLKVQDSSIHLTFQISFGSFVFFL
ncbi:hypothetical protein FWK35_00009324 [Aphis craccivora]|uniref:Uncharacterized protein n=1 Tax=Aphis craccivora TaxID=307492 RepID=A0A6G0Z0U9_APHCR|nr:hypothetical protein FWK35_00009324 [Aphis craccivora]